MRHLRAVLLIAFSVPAALPLGAQQHSRPLLGIGMSIDPARIARTTYLVGIGDGPETPFRITEPPIMFYLPITVARMVRIEPSFGIISASTRTSRPATLAGGIATTDLLKESSITFGLRGTYTSRPTDQFALSVGPRLDFHFFSSTSEYSYVSGYPVAGTTYTSRVTTDELDITVGAVVGAEYFPLPRFSIGGEVSLNYVSFGNPEETREYSPPRSPPPVTVTAEREQHVLRTDALIFLRWYVLQSDDDAVPP